MIRYSLRCDQGHEFESWFQSGAAFDALSGRGMVECSACGSTEVSKALMAPRVETKPELTQPRGEAETALARLRRKVESEATYVGGRFAEEARKLHRDKVEKPIYGEANARQIRSLLDDGVPIAPLPFLPKAKAN